MSGSSDRNVTTSDKDVAIYVPGFGSVTGIEWSLSPIRKSLIEQGYQPAIFHNKHWYGDIQKSGESLVRFIDRLDSPRVVVIGHSLGGLIARVADIAGANIDAVITLGTPHHGSPAANLLTEAGRQMALGSSFLKQLNERDHRARYLTVAGQRDLITWSAHWGEGHEELTIPGGHTRMMLSHRAADAAARFFGPARYGLDLAREEDKVGLERGVDTALDQTAATALEQGVTSLADYEPNRSAARCTRRVAKELDGGASLGL